MYGYYNFNYSKIVEEIAKIIKNENMEFFDAMNEFIRNYNYELFMSTLEKGDKTILDDLLPDVKAALKKETCEL